MIFKRMEIKRVLQDQRELTQSGQIAKLFSILKRDQIPFSIRAISLGHELSTCVVMDVFLDSVRILARKPANLTVTIPFDGILVLEADSNIDFIADETDLEGRMARLR
jgi:hypothetical protein